MEDPAADISKNRGGFPSLPDATNPGSGHSEIVKQKRPAELWPVSMENTRRIPLADLSNFLSARLPLPKVQKFQAGTSPGPIKQEAQDVEGGEEEEREEHEGEETQPQEDDENYKPVQDQWTDVDAFNEDDPQQCSAYASLIFSHLLEKQHHFQPSPSYHENLQADINPRMRAIVVDWLVEVFMEYSLCADTLFQTVNYFDRFLSKTRIPADQLQLVAITCAWIAAKFEEVYPPRLSDFCHMSEDSVDKRGVVAMEEVILKELKFELTVPTAKTFLRRLFQVCEPDDWLHFLANYITEVSLLDIHMLNFLPSQVAAAAVYLANLILNRPPWSANLQHYSTYAPRDFSLCVQQLVVLLEFLADNADLTALKDKYAGECFRSVSLIPISCIKSQ